MRSSHPKIVRQSTDEFVPRAPFVGLHPRPLFQGLNAGNDLRSQLFEMRYQGKRFMAFLAILLGDDEVLDVGVTANKRVKRRDVWSGTDHETMQPHGGELTYPTTRLWLPENFKNRGVTLGVKSANDFLDRMKTVLREVLKFGARATDVAKAFARMEFYLVQHVLFNVPDLRVALQALVKLMDDNPPLMTPLLPDIIQSDGFVPSASYILEPQPPGVGYDSDDLSLQLRAQFYNLKQYHIFLSILLGEDHPPDEDATVHDRGGALSVTDHDSLQPHGVPKTTVWLPEYLKKKDAIPGYNGRHCWDKLQGPFNEVMKCGARTTDVAKAFATMKIEHVELLLKYPEVLRTMLQQFDAIAEDEVTRELNKVFMSDLETHPETHPNFDIPLDVLPQTFLPDGDPLDDDYINLSFEQM